MSYVLDGCGFLTDMDVIYHSSFIHLESGYRQIISSIRSTLYPGTEKSMIEKVRDLSTSSSLPTTTPVPQWTPLVPQGPSELRDYTANLHMDKDYVRHCVCGFW